MFKKVMIAVVKAEKMRDILGEKDVFEYVDFILDKKLEYLDINDIIQESFEHNT